MIPLFLAASLFLQSYQWNYPPAPGPIANPMKGWVPFVGEGSIIHQPYSTVYFNVAWRDLEPQQGEYKFAEWEKKFWELPAAKGKHVVFRVNLDYPSEPSGMPKWLVDQGVKMTRYTDYGGGLSPDYTDPRLQKALIRFVKVLGNRYDSNPRVAFIQVGLLGFWGEWHTYPRLELFASEKFQKQVLESMIAAFPHKKLLARNPSGVAGKYPNLGFHDDMIPQDTLGSEDWKFLPGILANKLDRNWREYPRGGEMVPFAAKQYILSDFSTTMKAIGDVHFSWIGPYCPALEKVEDPAFSANCRQILRTMGYQFSLQHSNVTIASGKCTYELNGRNEGVAPFYYPWRVQLAFIDSKGTVAAQADTDIDIRKWQPGEFVVKGEVSLTAPVGKYRLALGIFDPYLLKPDVEFANSFEKIDGWQVLGQVQIKP